MHQVGAKGILTIVPVERWQGPRLLVWMHFGIGARRTHDATRSRCFENSVVLRIRSACVQVHSSWTRVLSIGGCWWCSWTMTKHVSRERDDSTWPRASPTASVVNLCNTFCWVYCTWWETIPNAWFTVHDDLIKHLRIILSRPHEIWPFTAITVAACWFLFHTF